MTGILIDWFEVLLHAAFCVQVSADLCSRTAGRVKQFTLLDSLSLLLATTHWEENRSAASCDVTNTSTTYCMSIYELTNPVRLQVLVLPW